MSAKSLILRPVSSKVANECVKRIHYSGKVVQNSQMHIGVFWSGKMEGAMSFGPPLDKRKTAGLVRGSRWQHFCELNRMAFSDRLPRNSESRALGVAFRLLRRHKPALKWVVSFADATQCGDGTIYRASGFVLTGIKANKQNVRLPTGETVHLMNLKTARPTPVQSRLRTSLGMPSGSAGGLARAAGAVPWAGHQFRYVRFLDPTWRERLTVPVIPFSDIPEAARMYLGKPMRQPIKDPSSHDGKGGEDPTLALHSSQAALDE